MKWYCLVPVVGLALIAGCSSSDSDEGAKDTSPVSIAWIPKNNTNAVFTLGQKGAEAKAAELTASTGRQVTSVYLATTAADQLAMVDEAISKKVSAINISCNDAVACATSIDKAVAAGIPVMTFDSDAPTSKRYSFYSLDNKAAGKKAAQLMGTLLNQAGKVGILTGVTYKEGTATNPSGTTLDRLDGFRNELATNYTNITVAANILCDKTKGLDCGKAVDDAQTANPDITGWFFIGNYPLTTTPDADAGSTYKTVMPVWEQATLDGKVKSIAFDSVGREIELVQAGLLKVLIGQKYRDWGYVTTQMAFDRVVSNKQFDSFIDTGYDVICSDNATQALANWNDPEHTATLPSCTSIQ